MLSPLPPNRFNFFLLATGHWSPLLWPFDNYDHNLGVKSRNGETFNDCEHYQLPDPVDEVSASALATFQRSSADFMVRPALSLRPYGVLASFYILHSQINCYRMNTIDAGVWNNLFDAALFMPCSVLVLMTNIWRRLPSCLCRISQPFNQIKTLMLSSPLSSLFKWRFWPSSQQHYFKKVTVTSLPFHWSGQQIGNPGTSSLGHRCHWHWSPLTLLVNWDAQ